MMMTIEDQDFIDSINWAMFYFMTPSQFQRPEMPWNRGAI